MTGIVPPVHSPCWLTTIANRKKTPTNSSPFFLKWHQRHKTIIVEKILNISVVIQPKVVFLSFSENLHNTGKIKMETETEIPYNKNIEDKKLFLFFGCVWLNISTGQTAPATVKIKEIELLGSDQFIHHYLLLLLFLERERVMIISQSCLTPFQILSSTLWVRNCPLFWDASSF